MPKAMPPDIAQFAKQHAPPGQELIWLRCRLLKPPVEIERPPLASQLLVGRKPPIPHDTLLELLDLDTGEGWDCRVIGIGHDFVIGDIFSALGQAYPGTRKIKTIALLLNHKTGIFVRGYSDISTAKKLNNELGYKRSLSFWSSPADLASRITALTYTLHGYYTSPLTPAPDRAKNIIKTAIAGGFFALLWTLGPGGLGQAVGTQMFLHPWLAVIVLPLGFLIALTLAVLLALPGLVLTVYLGYLFIRVLWALFEPPRFKNEVEYSFSDLIGWANAVDWWKHSRTDATYLYQDTAKRLHEYVKAHPDPDPALNPKASPVFVVGKMRGLGDKGVLSEE